MGCGASKRSQAIDDEEDYYEEESRSVQTSPRLTKIDTSLPGTPAKSVESEKWDSFEVGSDRNTATNDSGYGRAGSADRLVLRPSSRSDFARPAVEDGHPHRVQSAASLREPPVAARNRKDRNSLEEEKYRNRRKSPSRSIDDPHYRPNRERRAGSPKRGPNADFYESDDSDRRRRRNSGDDRRRRGSFDDRRRRGSVDDRPRYPPVDTNRSPRRRRLSDDFDEGYKSDNIHTKSDNIHSKQPQRAPPLASRRNELPPPARQNPNPSPRRKPNQVPQGSPRRRPRSAENVSPRRSYPNNVDTKPVIKDQYRNEFNRFNQSTVRKPAAGSQSNSSGATTRVASLNHKQAPPPWKFSYNANKPLWSDTV